MQRRINVHIDGDSFYSSIVALRYPELRGKAFGVILRKYRSPVAAASYEARPYGITAGMSRKDARKLCPGLPLILGKLKDFRKISNEIFELTKEYVGTEEIQRYSIDEMFIDLSNKTSSYNEASEIVRGLRNRIRERFGITFSAGVTYARWPAKMLSEHRKPDGQTVAQNEEEWRGMMWSKPVGKLIGIGPSNETKLKNYGINTIQDLANTPKEDIINILGKAGEGLWELAWGRDDSEIEPYYTPWNKKQVSSTFTLYYDTRYLETLEWWLYQHSSAVVKELKEYDRYGRTIKLWRGFRSDSKPRSRSKTVKRYLNEIDDVYQLAREKLLLELNKNPEKLWMLGVSVTNLIEGKELRELPIQLRFNFDDL